MNVKTIACISDTHGSHEEIDSQDVDVDILIHSGDWSGIGTFQEMMNLNVWFGTLPAKHIVCVAGNHDKYAAQAGYQTTKQMFTNAIYLDNDECVLEGLRIYGTPYSNKYGRWSFMMEDDELDSNVWSKIPSGIDILVVHGPPHGILDFVPRGGHVGSRSLRTHIFDRIKPKLVVFGHIHEHGGKIVEQDGIKFVNASLLDEYYILKKKPVKIAI